MIETIPMAVDQDALFIAAVAALEQKYGDRLHEWGFWDRPEPTNKSPRYYATKYGEMRALAMVQAELAAVLDGLGSGAGLTA